MPCGKRPLRASAGLPTRCSADHCTRSFAMPTGWGMPRRGPCPAGQWLPPEKWGTPRERDFHVHIYRISRTVYPAVLQPTSRESPQCPLPAPTASIACVSRAATPGASNRTAIAATNNFSSSSPPIPTSLPWSCPSKKNALLRNQATLPLRETSVDPLAASSGPARGDPSHHDHRLLSKPPAPADAKKRRLPPPIPPGLRWRLRLQNKLRALQRLQRRRARPRSTQ